MKQLSESVVVLLPKKTRQIPNWPGYAISSNGVLWSCRNHGGKLTNVWRELQTGVSKDGYATARLHNGTRRSLLTGIHRLILLAWVGPPPHANMLALHEDGDHTNNVVSNLYWGTAQDNSNDRDRHGTTARRETNGRAVLTDDVRRMRNVRAKTGLSYMKLARLFGISKRQAMRVCKGEHWPAAG